MTRSRQSLPYSDYYKDGSLRASGQSINSLAEGYWEWFRKDGTLMRSGYFKAGVQVGEWTTYDQQGTVYKVTDMKTGNLELALTRIAQQCDI